MVASVDCATNGSLAADALERDEREEYAIGIQRVRAFVSALTDDDAGSAAR